MLKTSFQIRIWVGFRSRALMPIACHRSMRYCPEDISSLVHLAW